MANGIFGAKVTSTGTNVLGGQASPNIQGFHAPVAGANFSQPAPVPALQARPTGADLFQSFRGQLNAPQSITPTNVANEFANIEAPQVDLPTAPAKVTGLQSDFFDREREARVERLRREFFGANGEFEQGLSAESAAGRLGSPVAQRILQSTVTDPFIQAQQDIESDIFNQQLQEAARVEELNIQNDLQFADRLLQAQNINASQRADSLDRLAQLRQVDSGNELQAQQANQLIQTELNQLAGQLAQAEAGLLSQEQIAALEAQLQSWEIAQDAEDELRRQKLDFIQIPFPESAAPNVGVAQDLATTFQSPTTSFTQF